MSVVILVPVTNAHDKLNKLCDNRNGQDDDCSKGNGAFSHHCGAESAVFLDALGEAKKHPWRPPNREQQNVVCLHGTDHSSGDPTGAYLCVRVCSSWLVVQMLQRPNSVMHVVRLM